MSEPDELLERVRKRFPQEPGLVIGIAALVREEVQQAVEKEREDLIELAKQYADAQHFIMDFHGEAMADCFVVAIRARGGK